MVGYHKERLVTTETEELLFIRIRNYYETGRPSSDQPALYKHPDKRVHLLTENFRVQFLLLYQQFTVQDTSHLKGVQKN